MVPASTPTSASFQSSERRRCSTNGKPMSVIVSVVVVFVVCHGRHHHFARAQQTHKMFEFRAKFTAKYSPNCRTTKRCNIIHNQQRRRRAHVHTETRVRTLLHRNSIRSVAESSAATWLSTDRKTIARRDGERFARSSIWLFSWFYQSSQYAGCAHVSRSRRRFASSQLWL